MFVKHFCSDFGCNFPLQEGAFFKNVQKANIIHEHNFFAPIFSVKNTPFTLFAFSPSFHDYQHRSAVLQLYIWSVTHPIQSNPIRHIAFECSKLSLIVQSVNRESVEVIRDRRSQQGSVEVRRESVEVRRESVEVIKES